MKSSSYKNKNIRSGFSLIEILIVAAIGSAIVLLVSNFSGNVNILNNLVSASLQSKSDVGQTLQVVSSEIRSAGPSEGGAYPIDAAGTSSFSFYSDIDKDGLMEHVRYFLASSSLWKGVIRPTGTPVTQYPTSSETIADVLDNVTVASATTLFAYYGTAFTGGTPPLSIPVDISQIRLVGVNLSISVRASGTPTSTESYATMVDIRNLRSN